ncbi:zona pellucida-binding protein 2-like [Mobula birostris]|uniref:zona pellucida-binding protein 2-like n=1 Tax=Mobula birostris TaxID=1983395 RepID=UPI003B282475
MPFRSLQVNVQLETTTCEKNYVQNSVKSLKTVLGFMCEQLSCVISYTAFNCIQWQTSEDTLEHHIQLNITVQSQGEDAIIPCKTGQECHNEETLREAYQKIHTFITQSKSVMEASNNVPPLYYVQESFKAMKVDHCLAGMGKLFGKNKPCMDCCVTCGPGSYSFNWTSICIPCPKDFYQHRFGRTQCLACPQGLETNGEGAVSSTDCYNGRIQGRLLDIKSKSAKQEESAENDLTAPKKERQTFNSTHLLITIVVCSLTFLGITVLTMYCLVAALRKEVTINQSPLRVKENANLKSMKYSPRHLTMTENQLKPFPCNLPMEADQNWGRGSYNEDGKQHLISPGQSERK